VTGPVLYVPNESDDTVSVIDTTTNLVIATIPVPGHNADTAAIRPDGAFVYVASETGIVSVISTATNSVVDTINVGSVPYVVTFSPNGTRAYVTNHSGNNVSVIDTATNSVVATIAVGGGPYGVAVSPDGARAYVTNEGAGTLSVIDTVVTNSVIGTISVGSTPTMVAVNPHGMQAYVNNYGSGTVSVIDTATNSVAATITVGSGPAGIIFSPDGTRAYIANYSSGTVSVIDTAHNSVIDTIPVGSAAGVAITPDGKELYVTNFNGDIDTVTVIDTTSDTVIGNINVGRQPEYPAAILSNHVETPSENTYQVIQLRWYGGVYLGGDEYADVFESTSGVPLEITSAVFAPDGTGNAIPSAPPTLIALGTVASLDWEQAILASVVLDADADYVHPSFIMLPIGNIADLPFAVPIVGAVTVSIDNTDVNVADPTGLVTFVFSEAPTSFALADTSAVGGTLSNLQQVSATTYTATFTASPNTDIANASVSVTTTTSSSVRFSSAVATFTGVDVNWAPSQMIDGMLTGPDAPGTYGGINGWAVYNTATGKSEGADALLTIANPLSAGRYTLTFTLYQNYYGNPGHILGDFALAYTTAATPTLASPQTPVSIQSASSLNGTTFSLLPMGELLANTSHNSIGTDTYTISASVDSAIPITGIFLDAIKNPALPGGGPGGQYDNGNFVVSEFTLDASTANSTAPFVVDTVVPTVAVSIDNTFITQVRTTGKVTFTFSEAPTAFTLADTRAVGGILSNLTGGGETYTATFTGTAKTQISNASVSVTAGSWQENNGNPGASGSTALFEVDTLTTPVPPTIIVNSYPAATRGQVIALSTLVAISDGFGLSFQELELWDSQGTAFGGQFVVKGVA
jgi:YVTN family beta-propeller protein